jgi:hypothetical protein
MMTRPTVGEFDAITGEYNVREMNDEEFDQYQKDLNNFAIEKQELKNKAKAKSELLEKLGITEEEAKLLLS